MTINLSLRQIPLTREQLVAGLASMSRQTVPESVHLVVQAEPMDFERRLDIRFQETFDNLDRAQIAILETSAGTRFALLRHRGAPIKGTEIAMVDPEVKRTEIDALIKEMGLSSSDVIWRKPSGPVTATPRQQGSSPSIDASTSRRGRLSNGAAPKSKADLLSQRIADLVRENDELRRRVAELASAWRKIETALAGTAPRAKRLARRTSAKSAAPGKSPGTRSKSSRRTQSGKTAPTDNSRAAS